MTQEYEQHVQMPLPPFVSSPLEPLVLLPKSHSGQAKSFREIGGSEVKKGKILWKRKCSMELTRDRYAEWADLHQPKNIFPLLCLKFWLHFGMLTEIASLRHAFWIISRFFFFFNATNLRRFQRLSSPSRICEFIVFLLTPSWDPTILSFNQSFEHLERKGR